MDLLVKVGRAKLNGTWEGGVVGGKNNKPDNF